MNPRCDSHDAGHGVKLRQVVIHGPSSPSVYRWHLARSRHFEELVCDGCQRQFTQGSVYGTWIRRIHDISRELTSKACKSCNTDGGYDLCLDCYSSGKTCTDPTRHRLYVFLVASPSKDNVGPYEAKSGSGRAECNICHGMIDQGAMYSECPPTLVALAPRWERR